MVFVTCSRERGVSYDYVFKAFESQSANSPFSASRFQVTVDFLLQQVAFLTERHASQLRAQMRKAAAAVRDSPAPSPQPGAESPFLAEILRRTGSAGAGQPRAPSSLTIRKDSPLPRNDNSVPGTPRNSSRPTATRTSSSNTAVVTTRNLGGSSKAAAAAANRSSAEAQRKRLSSLPIATSVDDDDDDDDVDAEPEPPSPEPADTSSVASSSSSSSSPAQSRIIRRPPRFQSNDVSSSFADDDDDDDAEPAFLPYNPPQAHSDGSSSGQHDLSATLRGNPRDFARRLPKGSARENIHHSQTSDSSASSAAVFVQGSSERNKPGVPMSPRRTMELAGRSPGGKGKGYSRDSDGTPSMGSSFSDLDGMLSLYFLTSPPHLFPIPFNLSLILKGVSRCICNAVCTRRGIGQQDGRCWHDWES